MADTLERLKAALAGRYAVERELGRGGMATVYLARDLKHDRLVAVKVLHPELAASLGSDRFLREIRITAKLNHPHILPLHDSGEADDLLYFVMPYVEGETLRDRLLRDIQLPLDETTRLVCEVADGLVYAHRQGLVHRDIKPENILLAGGHALVADFGIGRALGQAGVARLTDTGIAVGTPAYMSPEQWSAPETVDGRSDQYGLCCVAYEMLVGEPPFSGPNVNAILARQSIGAVPSIRVVRPTVPEAVEAAIAKGMAKVPADRFASVYDFAQALRAAERSAPAGPISAGAPTAEKPLTFARLRARGSAAAVLAAVIVAAIIFLPKVTVGDRIPLVPKRVVVDVLENQTGDPALDPIGRMVADWLTQSLQRTGIVDVVPSATALEASRFVHGQVQARRMRDPLRGLAEETRAGTVISGTYYRQGAAIQLQIQITDATKGALIDALEPILADPEAPEGAVEQVNARVTERLAVTLDDRLSQQTGAAVQPPTYAAYRAFDRGMEAYIDEKYQPAIGHFYEAFALDSGFVLPLLYAGFCQSNLGNRRAADSLADLVARVPHRLTEYDRLWTEYLQARMDGNNEAALRAIERAATLAPDSKAAYNASYLARVTNRPQKALALLESLDPQRGPMRGWLPYWINLTDGLHRLGNHEQELTAARAARRLHPDRADPLYFEALALVGLGRVAALERVLADLERMGPDPQRPVGSILREVALELRYHGHEGAPALQNRAARWYASQLEGGADTLAYLSSYAFALYEAGRATDAEPLARVVLRLAPDEVGHRALSGLLAAQRGERDSAHAVSRWLAGLQRPYLFGAHTGFRARIAAALGERDQAVQLLRQAFTEGLNYPRHPFVEFLGMRDYRPLRDLLTPRG